MSRIFAYILGTLLAGPVWAESRLWIDTLPTGYGECHLVTLYEGQKLRWSALMDAGPVEAWPMLQKALAQAKITSLDAIFLSHPHPNHYGMIEPLLAQTPVKVLYWPGAAYPDEKFKKVLTRWRSAGLKTEMRLAEARWDAGPELVVRILHPAEEALEIHEDSMVTLLVHGKNAVLFPGDLAPVSQAVVRREAEAALTWEGAFLQLVHWPHHGDTLDDSWIRWLNDVPRLVISVGANTYGLPRATLPAALLKKTLRTDREGWIGWESDGRQMRRRRV